MALSKQYISAINSQLIAARQTRQRRLVVLSGERQWAQDLLQRFLQHSPCDNSLLVTDQPLAGIDAIERQHARQLLGGELDLLAYDAWSGLDPDALAAVTGTLRGGGLLILLLPPLADWPVFNDPDYRRLLVYPFGVEQIAGRFVRHFRNSLLAAQHSLLIEQNKTLTAVPAAIDNLTGEKSPVPVCDDAECLSEDQARAVTAVQRVATGHRRRPLVITSDRGRGKSSAMGIASARIMASATRVVIITAPRFDSVRPVFERVATALGLEPGSSPQLKCADSRLNFIAPDALLRGQYKCDLLLVDEAAAIPASMLEQLLRRYSRIVFSTTVSGYEGTGRGFDVRFKKVLETLTPQWSELSLQQPIRWAEHDPVEQWLFDALLLEASVAGNGQLQQLDAGYCVIEKLDRDQLLSDRQLLGQLFGLLVLAHYQTTPSDLRNLLDGPNISIWVSRFRGEVVAVALVAREGSFKQGLSMDIWQGKRRPRGHLLPQTLAVHAGLQPAPALSYQRIMRVAVHPAAQRKGLGKQLLNVIIDHAREQQCDFIGSSFAATADVLKFWRSLQCVPVRLGVSRDACSGCHSAVVLSSLSISGEQLLATARQRFKHHFPRELTIHYQALDPELVAELLLHTSTDLGRQLDQQDWLDIEAFARGYRQYEMCLIPLWKLACYALSEPFLRAGLSKEQRALLVSRILQNRPEKMVADNLGLTGRKQLLAQLRKIVSVLRLSMIEAGM